MKEGELPQGIPIRICGHPATPATTYMRPSKTEKDVMDEFCLCCLLDKVIEKENMKPCGAFNVDQNKWIWRG